MTLKGYTIAVYGSYDDIGTQTYNLPNSHSVRRSCPRLLVQTGISPTIMSTKGFGKSEPRVPGDSEQARAANRRVEIGIVDSKLITNGLSSLPKSELGGTGRCRRPERTSPGSQPKVVECLPRKPRIS